MLYHKGKFVQVVEGEEDVLRALMAKIEKDERHQNVQYLVDESISERGFEQWNMDFFNLSDKQSLDHEQMLQISKLYKRQPMIRSSQLVKMYEDLLKEGVFVEA